MKDEELLRMLKCAKEAPTGTMACAYKTLFAEMITRMEKFRWHDLRKDPEDLPEERQVVLTLMSYDDKFKYQLEYEVAAYDGGRWLSNCLIANTYIGMSTPAVLAWKYIEPFSEVEDG